MNQKDANSATLIEQLIVALDRESQELKSLGQRVFHDCGQAVKAQPILRQARGLAEIRDQVIGIRDALLRLPDLPAPKRVKLTVRTEPGGPGLIKNMAGMSIAGAAKKLGVRPAEIKAALESGELKGYQRVTGTWKITLPDLIDYSRRR